MKIFFISTISSLAIAAPAAAEMASLSAQLEAGSLHTGALDMAAYRIDLPNGAHEVTATFRPRIGGEAQRVIMRLEDKDEVRFSIPGESQTIYTFARSADVVEIVAESAPVQVASR